jgi:Cft2 family RNA processing exonuclease
MHVVQASIVCASTAANITTHTRPLDWHPLDSGVQMTVLQAAANYVDATPVDNLQLFVRRVVETARTGGNTLVPVWPTSVLYDLLPWIAERLSAEIGVQVPIYYVSPVARKMCAHADVFGEWLTPNKHDMLWDAEMPFAIAKVRAVHNLHAYKDTL